MNERNYILNVVIPINILNQVDYLGAQVSTAGAEVYVADGNGGYTTEWIPCPFSAIAADNQELNTDFHTAYAHYVPLIENTRGAVWCVESIRRGIQELDVNLALSFATAFVEIKTEEIFCMSSNCNPTSSKNKQSQSQ